MSVTTRSGRGLTPSKTVLDAVEDFETAFATKCSRAASGKGQQQSPGPVEGGLGPYSQGGC